MVFLTKHEESIKARPWLAFKWLLNFFKQLLRNLETFPTHLSSSSSFPKKLSKFSVFQTLFFYRKQKCAISFHSLLSLPKRIQQGLIAWILFVSLFSLFQKNKWLTAWILLWLPSPLSKNSKWHSLRILLILSIPLYKSVQRTNRLRILLYPHSQSIKGLTAWDLCLNTLKGTSFVVQVEGTSTWVWLRTREGTSLVDQF